MKTPLLCRVDSERIWKSWIIDIISLITESFRTRVQYLEVKFVKLPCQKHHPKRSSLLLFHQQGAMVVSSFILESSIAGATYGVWFPAKLTGTCTLDKCFVFAGVITSQNQLRTVTDLEEELEKSRKKQRDNTARDGITYSNTRQNDNYCCIFCFQCPPTSGSNHTGGGGGGDGENGCCDCDCDCFDCDCDCSGCDLDCSPC